MRLAAKLPIKPIANGRFCGIIIGNMSDKSEKKRLTVLRILLDADKPVSSAVITSRMKAMGHDISERTVRLYLLELDRKGLTKNCGRKGRLISEKGEKELTLAKAFDKVGLLAARIDQMTYQMDFDLESRSGTVVINANVIKRDIFLSSAHMVQKVFAHGYAMGQLVTLFSPGQRIGDMLVPDDCIGFGTVCSVTLNGVLLAHGIPTNSRFGGLLELRGGKPTRFVELIHYEGTTIDPLEAFIRSGMTDYTGAVKNGNGMIGVSFREVPDGARDKVIELADKLKKVGLGGFLSIGWPGQPLLGIPVSDGRVGLVLIGGLNPIAILEENSIRSSYRALATFAQYSKLFSYEELLDRAIKL